MTQSTPALRIGFVGDIGLGPEHSELFEKHGPGFLHEKVETLLAGVDLAVGNLECSIPSFEAAGVTNSDLYVSPRVLEALQTRSNLHLCLANNHVADYGREGVASTLGFLRQAGIAHFGAGLDYAAAVEPHIVELHGIRVGMVCGADFNHANARGRSAGSAPLDMRRLLHQVQALKTSCRYVIVILHADEEFKDYPAPYRVRAARRLVDAGADAVIQHHPHVVQGVETYRGSTIAYSLGNWAFKITDYQAHCAQASYGAFFVLELPVDASGTQGYQVVHTRIDDKHRPVPLEEERIAAQQARLDRLSNIDESTAVLRRQWLDACKASLRREAYDGYYMLRKSGLRPVLQRVMHLFKEPLFRRQMLGLLSMGRL